MTPATWPRAERAEARLLHIDPASGTIVDRRLRELPSLLRAGDLVVVNDAATLPASLQGGTTRGEVEVRLAVACEDEREWRALLFGGGSWRQATEDRARPPRLVAGDRIEFDGGLSAEVIDVSEASPRFVTLRFDRADAALWSALYEAGRPVQYSYLERALDLWNVQTAFASRPWAVEMPSAAWGLTAPILRAIEHAGVELASVTHAAGLSSTGEAELDRLLPLPERFAIPERTVESISRARARGGRVIAIGTTVVRALEGSAAAHDGELIAGSGVTDLKLDHSFRPRIVTGLLTGMHEPTTSHFALMSAFAGEALLSAAIEHAEGAGYLAHEFGDTSLVLASGEDMATATSMRGGRFHLQD